MQYKRKRAIVSYPVLDLPLYKLDGPSFTSVDSYHYLCTVTGALWTPQGRSLDGIDDHILAGTNLGISGNAARTILVWVKLNAAADATPIVSIGSIATGKLWSIATGTGGLGKWTVWNFEPAGDFASSASSADDIGKFVLIAATHDGIRTRIYRNAEEIGGLTFTYDTDNSPGYLAYVPTWAVFSSSVIGEVYIYNRALSLGEIQRNYQETKWRYS